MATDLPTDIAASFPDRSPGDATHQQHHDTVHGVVNEVSAELEGRLSEAGLNAAMGEQASDPETPLGGVLSATYAALPDASERAFYVSTHGNDANDGLTPGSAKATVASALAALTALDALGRGVVWVMPGTYTLAAGLNITARQRVKGTNPDATRLQWSGTGPGVTLKGGANCSLEGVEVTITGTDASTVGVKIDGTTAAVLYWKLRDVRITATTKTAGQVGLLLENSPTTNIYWGDTESLEVSNFGTGIHFINDVTFGINANRFRGVKVHNCTTTLDLGTADGNVFDAYMADLFTLGISCNGIRNQIQGRLEGGTGSQTYQLLASSQENWIMVDDNCPTASTDAGTQNLVTALSSGKAKAWHLDPSGYQFPYTVENPMRGGALSVGVANRALCIRAKGGGRISKVRISVTTSSGNICVAIVKGALGRNGPTERVATTGSIACPAAGEAELTLDVPADVTSRHWFVISADNTTATFDVKGTASTVSARSYALGLSAYQDSAFPVPATMATSAATVPEFIMQGVA